MVKNVAIGIQDFEKIRTKNCFYIDKTSFIKAMAIHKMSDFLMRYYGKKVIILLDEYDTPMQEAYVHGFWNELVSFTRSLFNATFKTNPFMERTIMTGITRISSQSMFSDFNNIKVITTTTEKYETSFGFTEQEVFRVLDENGLGTEKKKVKEWYDGFTFGKQKDIYNPWSIINFLDEGVFAPYWSNTSSNDLANKLIREGNDEVKINFEILLRGETIICSVDEHIAYNQLNDSENAIWSLLLAGGYLKVVKEHRDEQDEDAISMYELAITNKEVRIMFRKMVRTWFAKEKVHYNHFIAAMLAGDIKTMNYCMKRITLQTFSYFDTGKGVLGHEPERFPSVKATTSSFKEQNSCACFYHGFVVGLLVDMNKEYIVTSNRESGFGRYDVMIEPRDKDKAAIILEFKVHDSEDEKTMEETVASALAQIEEKQYEANLIAKGIRKENIRKYGFAFEGKNVLIGGNSR